MKITSLFNATNVYNKNVKTDKKIDKPKKQNDSLMVSDTARDFQSVLKAVSNAPDVREDKVEQISEKIQEGSYDVSSEDIVNKLFSKF